jgi:hypothetical protein
VAVCVSGIARSSLGTPHSDQRREGMAASTILPMMSRLARPLLGSLRGLVREDAEEPMRVAEAQEARMLK